MTATVNSQVTPARVFELDGIRGIAVTMVLLYHCFIWPNNNLLSKMAHAFFGSMWMGVDLFFVLSGYLITQILLKARDNSHYYRNFYLRRVSRIWPAYALVLFFAVYLTPQIVGGSWTAAEQRLIPWMMLQFTNWAVVLHGQDFPWSWGVAHLWSLGSEEQFYLVWPVLVLHVPLRRLFAVCGGLFLLSLTIRMVMVANHFGWAQIYMMPLSHMDGLIAGAALSVLIAQNRLDSDAQKRKLILAEKIGWIGLLILMLVGPGVTLARPTWLFSSAILFATLAFVGMVFRIHFALLPAAIKRFLSHPATVWMGKYSYGIYLIHYVLLFTLQRYCWAHSWDIVGSYPNLSAIGFGILVIALTLVLARLMFHFIERPALNWGARYCQKEPVASTATSAV